MSSSVLLRGFALVVPLCVLVLAGCASTMSSNRGVYTEDLGTAQRGRAIDQIRNTLFTRHGYSLDRKLQNQSKLLYVTSWKVHTPDSTEQAEGYSSVRTRITLQGDPAFRSGGATRRYGVSIEGEYQVQKETNEWVYEPLPASREQYFEQIASHLERGLETGM